MLKYVCILVTLLIVACGGTMIENPHGESSYGIGDCDAGEAGTGGSAGSSAGSGGSAGSEAGTGGSSGSAGSGGTGGEPEPTCDFTGWSAGQWKTLTTPAPVVAASNTTKHALGVATDPSNPGTIYATFHIYSGTTLNDSAAGLYKSTDCGVTWEQKKSGQLHNVSVNPENPDELYVNNGVRGEYGFWYSDDGGDNWTKRTITDASLSSGENAEIMLEPNDIMRDAVDPLDWDHVIISSHYNGASGPAGLYESFDKGETWIGIQPLSGWGGSNAVAYLDANTLILGSQDTSNGGWWRSSSGVASTSTWSKVFSQPMSHGAMRPYVDGIGQFWIGPNDYIARSDDDGESWEKVGMSGSDSPQYWSAIGGVPSGTISPATGMTSSWAGRVMAGRWNVGPGTSSVRYTTETTSTTACFSNCGGCSNCAIANLTDSSTHAFATDPINGILIVSLLSGKNTTGGAGPLRALRY